MKKFFSLLVVALSLLCLGMASDRRQPTSIEISGELTANIPFPFGLVPVNLTLHARALLLEDGTAMGSGGHAAFFPPDIHIENSHYVITGASVEGDTVTLTGTIDRSSGVALPGTPFVLTADADGNLSFKAGPITGWPFAGQTHEYLGTGKVVVTTP